MNENRHPTKHIVKYQNTKDKKKKKTFKEKRRLDNRSKIRISLDFSAAIGQQWSKAFKILNENYFQSTLVYSGKQTESLSSELKHFQTYKVSKFTSHALFLRKLLDVLH